MVVEGPISLELLQDVVEIGELCVLHNLDLF